MLLVKNKLESCLLYYFLFTSTTATTIIKSFHDFAPSFVVGPEFLAARRRRRSPTMKAASTTTIDISSQTSRRSLSDPWPTSLYPSSGKFARHQNTRKRDCPSVDAQTWKNIRSWSINTDVGTWYMEHVKTTYNDIQTQRIKWLMHNSVQIRTQ